MSDDLYIRCEDLFKIYKTSNLEVVALRGLTPLVGREQDVDLLTER